MFLREKNVVYIVFEHEQIVNGEDGAEISPSKIHGVYDTRQIAEGKKFVLWNYGKNYNGGYLSILKKTIEGPFTEVREIVKGKFFTKKK